MNLFNWHEPAITAAQAAWAIGGVIVLNVVISLCQGLFRPARVKPDPEDDGVHGDGAWIVGREL